MQASVQQLAGSIGSRINARAYPALGTTRRASPSFQCKAHPGKTTRRLLFVRGGP